MRTSHSWIYQPWPILKKIPVMVGSKIIDRTMRIITKGELMKVATTWKQANFGTVMSSSLQLPHTGPNRTGVEKEVVHSSPRVDTMEVKEFCLDDVWSPVHTTWKVTTPPFGKSVYMAIPVSGDTICRSMCLQSQCQTPCCIQQWCWLQPMESYIQGPLRYPSVYTT